MRNVQTAAFPPFRNHLPKKAFSFSGTFQIFIFRGEALADKHWKVFYICSSPKKIEIFEILNSVLAVRLLKNTELTILENSNGAILINISHSKCTQFKSVQQSDKFSANFFS